MTGSGGEAGLGRPGRCRGMDCESRRRDGARLRDPWGQRHRRARSERGQQRIREHGCSGRAAGSGRAARPLGHAADPRWERLAHSIFLQIDRNHVIRNHDHTSQRGKGRDAEAGAGLFPLATRAAQEDGTGRHLVLFRSPTGTSARQCSRRVLGESTRRASATGRVRSSSSNAATPTRPRSFRDHDEYAPAFPKKPVAGAFTPTSVAS